MSRLPIITPAIGAASVLAVILLIIALLPWLVDPRPYLPAGQSAAAPSAMPTAPPRLVDPPAKDSFSAMIARPIFTATRRPPPLPGAAVQGGAKLIFGRHRLTGVVFTPSERLLLLAEVKTGATRALGEGAELDGWRIVRIGRNAASLQSVGDGGALSLRYADYR